MVQRTVLKVKLSCQKCKKRILTSITGLQGVDKVEIDAAKETLTVTGDADPYCIIVQARKIIKWTEVLTIGPPPPPPKKPDEEKKTDDKKQADKKPVDKKPPEVVFVPSCIPMPPSCVACPQVAVVHMKEDPCYTPCSIM